MSSTPPKHAVNAKPPNVAQPASLTPSSDDILQQMMQTNGCCMKAQDLHQALTSYLLGCTTRLYHIDDKSAEEVKQWDD